jgi:hypothetical protein
MGWVTQTLAEPVSFYRFIHDGFKGATFHDLLPPTFKTAIFGLIIGTDRMLSGNADTGRRRGRRPCGHEFGSLVLAVRDRGRCRPGESDSHIVPLSRERTDREIGMDTTYQIATQRKTPNKTAVRQSSA